MGSTQEDSDSPVTPEPDSSNPVSSVAEAVPLSVYGDELPMVRREAPEIFSTRRLDQEACVVFMAGYVPSLGASASGMQGGNAGRESADSGVCGKRASRCLSCGRTVSRFSGSWVRSAPRPALYYFGGEASFAGAARCADSPIKWQ